MKQAWKVLSTLSSIIFETLIYPKGRPIDLTKQELAEQEAAQTALEVVKFASRTMQEGQKADPQQRRLALQSIVKICVQQLQAEPMREVLIERHVNTQNGDPFENLLQHSYRLDPHRRSLKDLIRRCNGTAMVRLADGLSITAPWANERFSRALLRYGPGWGRRQNNFQWQQQSDQNGTVYLPWGIYCVGNGNHSAASGILWGDGELTIDDIQDWTPLLIRIHLTKKGLVLIDDPERLILVSTSWPILALIGMGPMLIEQGGTYGAQVLLKD